MEQQSSSCLSLLHFDHSGNSDGKSNKSETFDGSSNGSSGTGDLPLLPRLTSDNKEEGATVNLFHNHTFPCKLFVMLSENGSAEEPSDRSSVISWLSHGRAFKCWDKKRFIEEVLPNYFRQTKWESFQRQLNLYGFQRICKGLDKGAYFHTMFFQGRPDLCTRIPRIKLKNQGPRKPGPEQEPNFYGQEADTIIEQPTAVNVNHSASSCKVSGEEGKGESGGAVFNPLTLPKSGLQTSLPVPCLSGCTATPILIAPNAMVQAQFWNSLCWQQQHISSTLQHQQEQPPPQPPVQFPQNRQVLQQGQVGSSANGVNPVCIQSSSTIAYESHSLPVSSYQMPTSTTTHEASANNGAFSLSNGNKNFIDASDNSEYDMLVDAFFGNELD